MSTASQDLGADDLVFLPLGGSGEIGMNLNLYGLGGKWLMVDLGITFGDDNVPGIDIITPDPSFIVERRDDLLGLILTHAHEDHLGAVHHLWPELRCPVYATPFTAAVLEAKLEEHGLLGEVPLHVVPLGGMVRLGGFEIEFVSITHSIPESNALIIRTALGTVLHTGDWKLDPEPLVGEATDETALARLGDEGVLAMVGDSTNALEEGESGSEAAVRESLADLVAGRKGRVVITSFASNIARIKTAAEVARATERHLVVVGRSLWRMIRAADKTGYMEDLGPVLEASEGGYLPPDRVLYLATGCQGEPRGAMARIAGRSHPEITLEAGDLVVFSSKVIPGNERSIGRLQDRLVAAGIEVVGEKDHFVHVSGHPCRDELRRMYQWVRPAIAVPVHGEIRHLAAHAALARELQVPDTVGIENGRLLRLAPGGPEIIGEVQSGRRFLDGKVLSDQSDEAIRERRRLMYNGVAVVTLMLDTEGDALAPPSLVLQGVPRANGEASLDLVLIQAVEAAIELLPASDRRDDGRVQETARVALRRALKSAIGKRPVVEARVVRLEG